MSNTTSDWDRMLAERKETLRAEAEEAIANERGEMKVTIDEMFEIIGEKRFMRIRLDPNLPWYNNLRKCEARPHFCIDRDDKFYHASNGVVTYCENGQVYITLDYSIIQELAKLGYTETSNMGWQLHAEPSNIVPNENDPDAHSRLQIMRALNDVGHRAKKAKSPW